MGKSAKKKEEHPGPGGAGGWLVPQGHPGHRCPLYAREVFSSLSTGCPGPIADTSASSPGGEAVQGVLQWLRACPRDEREPGLAAQCQAPLPAVLLAPRACAQLLRFRILCPIHRSSSCWQSGCCGMGIAEAWLCPGPRRCPGISGAFVPSCQQAHW